MMPKEISLNILVNNKTLSREREKEVVSEQHPKCKEENTSNLVPIKTLQGNYFANLKQ